MFTAQEIANAAGGRLSGGNVTVTGVSTDTRTIEKGCLYVAVKGERFDGSDFIADAAAKGAAAAVTDRPFGSVTADIPIIYVQDSRTAQLELARHYRRRFSLWLCGVTGSVGKTSTKDMISAVLSAKYNTLKTEGNFNNDIGLPKMLFRLNEGFKAAVIEMGMSDLGEISALSRAACPNIAVITNIGWCHLENLKTRENILKAKLEILDGASEDCPLILNGDDEYLDTVTAERAGGRDIVRFGFGESCDVRAENIASDGTGERFVIADGAKRYEAFVPVTGEHHVKNALAAYCVGKHAGMDAEEIIPALTRYEASGMRQKIEQRGGVTVILDCYNASPDSMRSSLSVLGGMKRSGRRIAVLGDMLELGERSAELHAMVADFVAANADACFLYGGEMQSCFEELKKRGFEVYHGNDKAKIAAELTSYLKSGDFVLFKGSRGMRMEEIADAVDWE